MERDGRLHLRCPKDDGTDDHAAIDVELPLSLASGLLLGLGELQCTCGEGFVVVAEGAMEPKVKNESA